MEYYTVRETGDGRIILAIGPSAYVIVGPETARRIGYALIHAGTPECDRVSNIEDDSEVLDRR